PGREAASRGLIPRGRTTASGDDEVRRQDGSFVLRMTLNEPDHFPFVPYLGLSGRIGAGRVERSGPYRTGERKVLDAAELPSQVAEGPGDRAGRAGGRWAPGGPAGPGPGRHLAHRRVHHPTAGPLQVGGQ